LERVGIVQENDINTIAASLNFLPTKKKAIKYHFVKDGKTGEMPAFSYTQSNEVQRVITTTSDGKETENTANVGDIIMSGPSKENYVVKADKFQKLYNGGIGNTVVPDQTPKSVAVYTGSDTIHFKASWGEDMVLKPNDYLVKSGENKYYRIAKKEYEETYNEPGK
jgi:hypothetical protein